MYDIQYQIPVYTYTSNIWYVSRDSPRRRRGKTDTTPPVLNQHYLAVKKWPLRENVGHAGETRCSHLVTSGRRTSEGERERSQMIGWDHQNGSGAPFPSAEVNRKKFSFWAGFIAGRRTIAILLRAEDKKINWDTKDSLKSFKPVLKTEQSLVARERRKFSSGIPRRK